MILDIKADVIPILSSIQHPASRSQYPASCPLRQNYSV
ncbi:hypothetical protein D1AOALGA4SA_11115 [Olavius algarvensis Delta 1 endosymbiont]|nr:hypothetical protein D1AOALGA4SA_11115 [Olavius algarvensis Delta 1 endosymbiont]